jgi:hypothetical protein
MLSKLRMYSLYDISKTGLLAKQVSGKYLATKDAGEYRNFYV